MPQGNADSDAYTYQDAAGDRAAQHVHSDRHAHCDVDCNTRSNRYCTPNIHTHPIEHARGNAIANPDTDPHCYPLPAWTADQTRAVHQPQ